jgi:hypothetical protein
MTALSEAFDEGSSDTVRLRGSSPLNFFLLVFTLSIPVCGELLILAECKVEVQTCESFAQD